MGRATAHRRSFGDERPFRFANEFVAVDVHIDLSACDDLEISARLLTILAWPDYQDGPTACFAQASLIASILEAASMDPTLARKLMCTRPAYLQLLWNKSARWAAERLWTRINHRLAAAWILKPFVDIAWEWSADPTTPGDHPSSIATRIQQLGEIDSSFGAANAPVLILRPTYPVLHIALALLDVLGVVAAASPEAPRRNGLPLIAGSSFLLSPLQSSSVLWLSRRYEEPVLRASRFRVNAESQVRLRLVGPPSEHPSRLCAPGF